MVRAAALNDRHRGIDRRPRRTAHAALCRVDGIERLSRSPHIEDTAEFLQAYVDRGAALSAVTKVRFDTAPGDRRYFEPRIRVRVLSGEPPPSQATLESFKAYGTHIELPDEVASARRSTPPYP